MWVPQENGIIDLNSVLQFRIILTKVFLVFVNLKGKLALGNNININSTEVNVHVININYASCTITQRTYLQRRWNDLKESFQFLFDIVHRLRLIQSLKTNKSHDVFARLTFRDGLHVCAVGCCYACRLRCFEKNPKESNENQYWLHDDTKLNSF